ncbi:hypothetical protein BJY01DRAFT_169010 [Aspergillus pseudoustus]|uniref:Uncharacterized protein n=1 Tax=Aspergillus pseudoustus TaxID=1810923 RepID=A0ABR4K415_9EURO
MVLYGRSAGRFLYIFRFKNNSPSNSRSPRWLAFRARTSRRVPATSGTSSVRLCTTRLSPSPERRERRPQNESTTGALATPSVKASNRTRQGSIPCSQTQFAVCSATETGLVSK